MYLIQDRISVLIHFRLPFIIMARPQEKVSVFGRISCFLYFLKIWKKKFVCIIFKKDFRHCLACSSIVLWCTKYYLLLLVIWNWFMKVILQTFKQVLLNKLQLNITEFTNFRPKMVAFSLKTFRLLIGKVSTCYIVNFCIAV